MEPQDVADRIINIVRHNGGVADIHKPTGWDDFCEHNGLFILKNRGYQIEEFPTLYRVTAPPGERGPRGETDVPTRGRLRPRTSKKAPKRTR